MNGNTAYFSYSKSTNISARELRAINRELNRNHKHIVNVPVDHTPPGKSIDRKPPVEVTVSVKHTSTGKNINRKTPAEVTSNNLQVKSNMVDPTATTQDKILQQLANQAAQHEETVTQLCKGLQALRTIHTPLPTFEGKESESVDQFLEDLDRILSNNPNASNADKLATLAGQLKEGALIWFRVQPGPLKNDYTALRNALIDNYKKSDFQNLTRKAELYKLHQKQDELFRDFVLRVRQKAAGTGIQDQDLVSICISGALPALQPFLVVGNPTTLQGLISLPIIADKSFESKVLANTPYLAVINDQLKAINDKITTPKREVSFDNAD